MSRNFQLNVAVLEGIVPPPTFSSQLYSVSASEGDYTVTVSYIDMHGTEYIP